MASLPPVPLEADVDKTHLFFSEHNQFTQEELRTEELHLNNIRQERIKRVSDASLSINICRLQM